MMSRVVALCVWCLFATVAAQQDEDKIEAVCRNYHTEAVDVFFTSVDAKLPVKIFTLEPDSAKPLNTFVGHTFFMQVAGTAKKYQFKIFGGQTKYYDLMVWGKPAQLNVLNKIEDAGLYRGKEMFDQARDLCCPIQFVNRYGEDVDIYYDDGRAGVWQGVLRSNKSNCINSYEGHKFFLTRQGDKRKRLLEMSASSEGHPTRVLKSKNMPAHEIERLAKETAWHTEYYEREGRHWLAELGRPPPKWHMWDAGKVGDVHKVTTEHNFYTKVPEQDEDHSTCKSSDNLELELEVVSTSPKVFVIKDFLSIAEVRGLQI
jgi:hypothetical protein